MKPLRAANGRRSLLFFIVAPSHDLAFVRDIVARLQSAGISTWLFGGWAEELLGLEPPRAHNDVDLLYHAADFGVVDAFMAADSGTAEIAAKRFLHKRAFLSGGIMVEMILVQVSPAGTCFTCFWGEILHYWPADVFTGETSGLRIASAASLRDYRACHARLGWSPGRPAQPGR